MTRADVVRVWGYPDSMETTTTRLGRQDVWQYSLGDYRWKTLIFENDSLEVF